MNAEQDDDDDGSHYRRDSFTQENEIRKTEEAGMSQTNAFLAIVGDNNLHLNRASNSCLIIINTLKTSSKLLLTITFLRRYGHKEEEHKVASS